MSTKYLSTISGSLLVASAAVASPTLNPNSQPYKVSKPPAATGRAGNATLAARALMNKDGTTDFDVTTGTLDSSATAPGNISKVQFKAYNGAGDVQWTRNYNSLTSGGRLHYSFADLHRGQPVQTQANIDKIDKRTDVVTVTGGVKLRPDLSVLGVDAPDQAVVGTHVDISAKVQELNGDTGARGNCKLLVDGTQVDQALGIYVDASGLVTCAFNYEFDATGSHTLTVTVDGVVPGDWDTSNNSASKTISIIDRNAPTYFNANVYSYSGSWNDHSEGHYYYNGYYNEDWNSDSVGQQTWEGAQIWGWSPTVAQFPLRSTSLTITSDGTPAAATMPNSSTWSWGDIASGYGGTCEQHYSNDGQAFSVLCGQTWSGYSESDFNAGSFAGEVTYHSQGYDYYYYYYWGGVYTYVYNYDVNNTWGSAFPVGSQVQVAAQWVDAAGTTFAPTANITTQATSWGCQQALTCWGYDWGWGSEQYCYSCNDSFSGVQGWTSGSSL